MARPHPVLYEVATGVPIDPRCIDLPVVRSAIEHRMSGMLLSRVKERMDELPSDASKALLAFDMAISAQREGQSNVLRTILRQLGGMEFAVFKGAASAVRWFDEPSERFFADIDIILGPGESLSAAMSSIDPSHRSIPLIEARPAEISTVTSKVSGIPVDIQTDALRMGIRPRAAERWWDETEFIEIPNVGRVRVFRPEADLVLFLLHQARDRFRYLIGVAEARRRFVAAHDWARVESLARMEGIWDQVAAAVACICDELQMRYPIEIPATWQTRLWRRLWNEKVRLLGETGRLRYIRRASWLMPLLTRGRMKDTLRWMMRSALPSKEALAVRHPRSSGNYLWRLINSRVRIIGRRRVWIWKHRKSLDR